MHFSKHLKLIALILEIYPIFINLCHLQETHANLIIMRNFSYGGNASLKRCLKITKYEFFPELMPFSCNLCHFTYNYVSDFFLLSYSCCSTESYDILGNFMPFKKHLCHFNSY